MSDYDFAIRVEGLGKQYFVADIEDVARRQFNLRRTLTTPIRRTVKLLQGQATGAADLDKTIWALKDVSFEVKRGQLLGVIGANGAGKSTLLKILGRVTEPTEGRAIVNGRVGSLLEVGTGFHDELTGRENVYLNGSILGMTQQTIRRQFDEIVEFSEVGKFIDTPVKHYSSGMQLRLAFAIAAQLRPEILLVDEVLSVGDAHFRQKSLAKMREIIQHERTILFVSHNLELVRQLCPQSILLENGHLVMWDDSVSVIEHYLTDKTKQGGNWQWQWTASERANLEPFIPLALRIRDSSGTITNQVGRKQFTIELEYELTRDVPNMRIGFTISTYTGERFCTINDFEQGSNREPGHFISQCAIPGEFFNDGNYVLGIVTGMRFIRRLYRDYELLTFHVSTPSSSCSTQEYAILRPAFDWETMTAHQF